MGSHALLLHLLLIRFLKLQLGLSNLILVTICLIFMGSVRFFTHYGNGFYVSLILVMDFVVESTGSNRVAFQLVVQDFHIRPYEYGVVCNLF